MNAHHGNEADYYQKESPRDNAVLMLIFNVKQ